MSLEVSRVHSFPARVLGAAGEAVPRARRGKSAGRRSGDKRDHWADATALLIDEVTTREAADTILAQRDRMIAIFGHDLRGLLNALTVNADVFLRQEEGTRTESSRNVRLAIGRMDQLTTSLLDYVRLKANKLEIVARPIDATELVREAVEIFRPLAQAKSLSLTIEIPDAPLRAAADHDRMFQVLSNLLSNAIKFSSVKGRIAVQATASGRDLQVAVRDDGPGIPECDLERVFDCFCQLQDSDARGLGLGLYISRAIIQAHGGKIWATSRPGAGSTFTFTVPRSDSPAAMA